MSDPNEVDRLRARVADLEAQLAIETSPTPDDVGPRASKWRGASGAMLIVLACVLAPLSVTSVWASTQLSDTDRYVETIAPLAKEPAVQSALADAVTRELFEQLDVDELTDDALTALAERDSVPSRVAALLPSLATPISNGVEGFARDQVNDFLESDRFAEVWEQVNRVAHAQVVRLLDGDSSGAVSAQDDAITINLAPIIEQVKEQLEDRGFALASTVPAVDKSFVLVQSDSITDAQGAYRLLNTLGTWLPLIALVLVVAGVALATERRRALIRATLGITAAMLVLGVLLALARMWYVGSVPAGVLTPEGAGSVFDTLVRFLRTGLRALAALALVIAFAAFMTGPSAAAHRARRTLARGIGSLRGGAEAAGWNAGRAGTWTYAHKRALQIAAVSAGGVALAFWSRPTGGVVIIMALLVVVVLAVIEFLARPVAPVAATAREQPRRK